MVREVISLNIGQAGNQLGLAVWRQYNAEHSINKLGKRENKIKDSEFQVFYEETNGGQFVPRNIGIDLEPNVIDDIRNSDISALFHPEFLVNGKEDAANNFARGHYTVGKELIDQCNDRIRKLVDHCDNVQGFIVNHSVGGGTGSGLGALILERLAVDFRKKSKLGYEIYPSPTISTCVVEPYNALLSTHWLLDHTEVSVLLDNEAIYSICQKNLKLQKPSYENLNRLIAKCISSMTASLRFGGEMNVDLNEFQTNLVPFPRLHFMTSAMSPIQGKDQAKADNFSVQGMTDECFQPKNMLVKYTDFDPEADKYMAISLNYRGDVQSKESNATVQWLKNNKKITFVEWCPTGFKIGLNSTPAAQVEGDDLAEAPRNVTLMGNNVAIARVFVDRVARKYDLMYSQRAYVHWFVGEGMEEGEFAEAREDLGFLEKDYMDVLSEGASDEAEAAAEEDEEDY